jgi:hypothetical protein
MAFRITGRYHPHVAFYLLHLFMRVINVEALIENDNFYSLKCLQVKAVVDLHLRSHSDDMLYVKLRDLLALHVVLW